jgi:acyl-CoA synthetase (AMP-forming)/AMP-acid ligase II
MAADGHGDRVALGSRDDGITFADLARRAAASAALVRAEGAKHLLFLGRNGPAVPQALFAAAWAGIPFTPVNYRLTPDRLARLAGRLDDPFVLADPQYEGMIQSGRACRTDDFLAVLADAGGSDPDRTVDDDAPAVLLFTSGTTAEPKIVPLSHGNLATYIIETVGFGSADAADCALSATPPYHIAAVAAVLSNVYAGRRVVYLPDFDASRWLRLVREEKVSSAMVVPTMLSRIVDVLDGTPAATPSLRLLSYGGSRAAPSVVEAAMAAFPGTGFVNAYGLTETSSTVALLGPDDHRAAITSREPAARRRLTSVGRPVPGIEIEIRDELGEVLAPGHRGELWLRGPQVSAQYLGSGSVLDAAGWFPTRDQAHVDDDGYLFIEGRLDETIIRGGENIAPAEVEDVLRRHPGVADVAVVGVPDEQWGERMIAVVVRRAGATASGDGLREWARERLRTSRTPDEIRWAGELPYSPMGKLRRREVAAGLGSASGSDLAGEAEAAVPLPGDERTGA